MPAAIPAALLRPDHPYAVAIRHAERAAGAGDFAAMHAVQWEDMVVHAGGRPVGGSTVGRAALSGGTLRGTPVHVAASDEQAVVVLRVTAERPGRPALDVTLLEVWRLREGKLAEAWDYFSDQEAWERFWNE